MIYRQLAGEKVSQLGFGAMRLPMAGNEVNVPETIRMIHRALDAGINYIDTAWVYHGGKSEGMQFMDESIWTKLRSGMISAEEAYMKSIDKTRFKRFLPASLSHLGDASGESPMTH